MIEWHYPPSMASVQGPIIPTKAGQRHRNFQPIQPAAQPKADPFYGHEVTARLCARFITHLYACPEYPPSSTVSQAKLPYFIAYALHRTKLHSSVTFAALVLLQRLKARFPTARGSSGHRLFISAFMIASKVICDDTYSNKSWAIVAQGMFTLREINQMEREMCSYLDWELTVDNPILQNFEAMVTHDFSSAAPASGYPTYSLQMVSKRAAKAAASASATPVPGPISTESPPIPMFHQRHDSPAKKVDPPPPPRVQRNIPYPDSPVTPDTPTASYGDSTSPESDSPQTPVGPEDFNAKIHSYDDSPVHPPLPNFHIITSMPDIHPLKGKMFAYAVPASW